jgi:transcriptional regulator with XRE-family HTH domain
MTVGEYIRSLRKGKSMTLDQASNLIGCSKSYLWEVENGKSMPSLEIAAAISFALKGDMDVMALCAIRHSTKEQA